MNSILMSLAALLVLAMTALFGAPLFIDWNDHRELFETQASRLVGRKVDVGGAVSLRLLPAPVLRFENVNVADEEGRFDTPFASARSFTVWLAVPPLLRGVFQAREVEIEAPVLNLRIRDDGSGNWRDVGRPDQTLPFLPQEVALESVQFADATVTLRRGQGDPSVLFDRLSGVLSARSLHGPYKFVGSFVTGNAVRELRFSTGRQEQDGAIRLKAALRDPAVRRTYLLDGILRGITAAPEFEGNAEVRFGPDPGAGEDVKTAAEKAGEEQPLAVKAGVRANASKALLEPVEIMLSHEGKPQTIQGAIVARYADRLAIEADLKSRWIDLDSTAKLSGSGASDPAAVLEALANIVLHNARAFGDARLAIALEQAVLGGDLLQGLEAELKTDGGAIAVERLTASLPGDNALTLDGRMTRSPAGPVFGGSVSLQGARLSRLLRWAGADDAAGDATTAGAYGLRGALSLAPQRFYLSDATGNLGGSAFTGSFGYRGGERPQVSVSLDADRLDLVGVLGPDASLASLLGGGTQAAPAAEGKKSRSPLDWLGRGEADISLRVGAMVLPGLTEGAVDAALHLSGGALDIRRLDAAFGEALTLKASGKLEGLDRKPNGALTVKANAGAAEGLQLLATLLDLPESIAANKERLARLAPAALAAEVKADAQGALVTAITGKAGGSDLSLKLGFGGALAEWRTAKLDFGTELKNGDGKALLRQVFPKALAESHDRPDSGGKLKIAAQGVGVEGLNVVAALEASGIEARSEGKAVFAAAGGVTFEGAGSLKAGDMFTVAALAGVHAPPNRVPVPLQAKAKITLANDRLGLGGIEGKAGTGTLTGTVTVDLSGVRPRLEADLDAAGASLPGLLAPLITWHKENPADNAVRGVSQTRGYWPDRLFNIALMDSADGKLALDTPSLALAGGMVLKDARLEAELDTGVIKIARLAGKLYGGGFDATATLARRGAGLSLGANFAANGISLDRIAASQQKQALARGTADLALSLAGEGLTPGGLAASLSGEGTLKLAGGEVRNLSPDAPRVAAAEFGRPGEDGAPQPDQAAFARAVKSALDESGLSYGPVEARIEVRNGVARLPKLTLQGKEGSATVTTFLEFASLRFDSEWELKSQAREGEEKPPSVALIFTGRLGDLGSVPPDIRTSALERQVTIRQMEKDVEALEKLDVTGGRKKPAGNSTSSLQPGTALPGAGPPPPLPEKAPARRGHTAPPTRAAIPPASPSAASPPPPSPSAASPSPPPSPPVAAAPATPGAQTDAPLPWLSPNAPPPAGPALGSQPLIIAPEPRATEPANPPPARSQSDSTQPVFNTD